MGGGDQRQPWPRNWTAHIVNVLLELKMDTSGTMRRITGLADGAASSQHGCTVKQMEAHVATAVQGLVSKENVDAATTGALPANTRTGDVLTATGVGAFPTIDAVAAGLNKDYLVKNEGGIASHINDGIYTLTVLGDGATPWELTRRADLVGGDNAGGSFMAVEAGILNGDKTFRCINDEGLDIVNTDALSFVYWGKTVDHDNLLNVTANQHHAQSHAHNGADGSGTVAHSDTTGQGADDHHLEDTFARQMKIYQVSKSKGSDSAPNDGGWFKPYATIQKAVTIGEAAYPGGFAIQVDKDDYSAEVLTITKTIAISGMGGINAAATRFPVNVTIDGGILILDNFNILSSTFSDGVSSGSILIEECLASFAGAEGMAGLTGTVTLFNTYMYAASPLTHLPAVWAGSFLASGIGWFFSTGMDAMSNKLTNLADGVGAQDGAAFGQIGAAITTHTGLPNAHHAEVHGIADNTKHTGSLVNDNIVLGDANGLVKDSGVAISSILGGLIYQGTWDASTNTPTLADGTGTKGHYYRVSVAGSQDLGSGSITFAVEDFVAHNGSIWQKIDHTDQVTSVFTRQGAVVATNGDYTASQVTNVPAGDIAAITVQAAIDELDADKVAKTLFDANTILKADSDNTPAALTVAEQTLIGRITSGVITALTVAQVRTLLGFAKMATGSYSGDGTTSQAITGVGFQPKYVKIWRQESVTGQSAVITETTDTIVDDNISGMAIVHVALSPQHRSRTNAIISLGADGFTVDDANSDRDPNSNGVTYNYLCVG